MWLCACDGIAVAMHHDHLHVRGEGLDSDSEEQAVEVDAAMGALVDRLLKRHSHPPSQGEMIEAGLRKVNVNAAAKRLEGKLPADVASLVHVGIEGKSKT